MEEVEVVIVMDYSLPLDLPIAVIPYLSSAGRQKHRSYVAPMEMS